MVNGVNLASGRAARPTDHLKTPARRAVALIGAFVVLRLIADSFVGLGTDESYSVGAAANLHLSYFDHPPMHYWLAHLMQPMFGLGRADRLPFIVLFAGTSWLMFVLTRRLFGARAGLWTVAALNLSGFFTLAAGEWVLPDGPLLFGLTGAATALARRWFPRPGERARPWADWLAAGVWIGLAGLSKYQAALFCVGLAAFVLTTPRARKDLTRPPVYAAATLALAMLSPVLIWNAQRHWASFGFQGARGAPRTFHPFGAFEALLGQAALLLPWIAWPLALAVVAAVRGGRRQERFWFCLMLAAPCILVFTLTPIFGPKALPHWSMPGWIFVFPLLGERLDLAAAAGRTWPRRWAIASAAFIVLIGALAVWEDADGFLGAAFPKLFKHGDPTAESIEWTGLRAELARRGELSAAAPQDGRPLIVALKWNEAGKVDQALGDAAEVTAFTPDPRQFAYRGDRARWIGRDALIVGRADTVRARMAELATYFKTLKPQPSVFIGRHGRREMEIAVVEGHGLIRPYPLPAAASPAAP